MNPMKIFVASFLLSAGALAQTPKPLAQMNDLSVLLPLASTSSEIDAYLKATDSGIGGNLIPVALFNQFNTPLQSPLGPIQQLKYETLRLIAFRFDPCFAQIGPIKDVNECKNQIRAIFQSLSVSGGRIVAEDSGLHAFYSLSRSQLKSAIEEVIALRMQSGESNDLGPLNVHPLISKQGLSGPMNSRLSAILKKYIGAANLTRLTRMNGTSDTWTFNGVDISKGKLSPMVIPSLPNNATLETFRKAFVASTRLAGSFVPTANPTPDNMQALAQVGAPTDNQTQQSAIDAAVRIENPAFHSPNTTSCASCHLAQASLALSAPGLWSENRFLFVTPVSVPATDLQNLTENNISSKNFHAFSYRGDQPMIIQRVINETAEAVDYVNSVILK